MDEGSKKNNEQKNSYEFEGITVAEAINEAMNTLHMDRAEMEITILREGKRGLFGMKGAETAKIRVIYGKKET